MKDIFSTPQDFLNNYNSIYDNERDSFLRHSLINNVPFAFKLKPLLFEQIAQYLADSLSINPTDIKLIGSGKTGFSISPPPNYGNPFTPKSDLDFSIINEQLFLDLQKEFYSWAEQYNNKTLLPQNKNQEIFWPQNLENCSTTLNRGFIDTYKIPSHSQFVITQKINQSLYLIQEKLGKIHNINISKASTRVYKNWRSFGYQLKLNTERVLTKVSNV
ncbi:MAG: hypothetical protein IPK31_15070 [Chitinophagaceae bacterium]|nr:hypothetical protein [Chitinophagaceae bacterium]